MSSFSGYVQTLSPKKRSRKTSATYFDFCIQTEGAEYKRAVCFHPNFHEQLKEYERSKTPITISNASEQLNKYSNTKEIIVNKRARIQATNNHEVSFEFEPRQRDETENVRKVKIDALKNLEPGEMVVLEGRLHLVQESTGEKEVNGEVLKFNPKGLIQDETGVIPITIWGDANDQLQNNKCYEFTNVKYRLYQHQKSLTSTPRTTFIETNDEFPEFSDETIKEQFQDLHVEGRSILAAEKFKRWCICKRCKKALTDVINLPIATCSECRLVQRPATCETNASVRVQLELAGEKTLWLTVFKEIIIQILESSNEMTEMDVTLHSNDDDVYLALLLLPGPMQVYFNANTEVMSTIEIHYERP